MKTLRLRIFALVALLVTVGYISVRDAMPRDMPVHESHDTGGLLLGPESLKWGDENTTPVTQDAAPAAAVVEEPSGPVTGAPETSVRVSAPASPPTVAPEPPPTTTTLPQQYLSPDGGSGFAKAPLVGCYDADNRSAPPLACPPGVPDGTGIHL